MERYAADKAAWTAWVKVTVREGRTVALSRSCENQERHWGPKLRT